MVNESIANMDWHHITTDRHTYLLQLSSVDEWNFVGLFCLQISHDDHPL